HGAHPHEGIDPIFIASNLVISLQSIISRNLSPVNSAVFTIGSIHGGSSGNIIPNEVKLVGILRTLDENTRVFLKDRIKSIVENVSTALGGEGNVFIRESYGALINDDDVVNVVKETAENILGKDNIIISQYPNMGTEDFSYFTKEVKSCFYNLGCRNEKLNAVYPIHSSHFNIDENCLKLGVMLQVNNVLNLQS
ncbi:MAG: amidohydrolase, partial [Bacillota bacterium]|nr:amidohydrolase [Bacillota bacterium]